MPSITVGPWVFSANLLAIALGLAMACAAAGFLKKRAYADVSAVVCWLFVAALVAARAAYVVRWWPGYADAPWWSVLDIRDGGFMAAAAVLVIVIGTLACMVRRVRMRGPLAFSVIVGLVVWGLVIFSVQQLRKASHPPLPDLVLQQLDGEPVKLSSLRGQPMVINLWATWCAPCRREMPMLVAASHKMPQVHFVFVDQGESAAAVQAFLRQENLAPKTMLLDAGNAMAGYYNAPGYPTTLFVDSDGKLQDLRIGALSAGSLHQHLQHILPHPDQ